MKRKNSPTKGAGAEPRGAVAGAEAVIGLLVLAKRMGKRFGMRTEELRRMMCAALGVAP